MSNVDKILKQMLSIHELLLNTTSYQKDYYFPVCGDMLLIINANSKALSFMFLYLSEALK